MAQITDKLRAILALDPEAPEIDFEGCDYTWGQIGSAVMKIVQVLDAIGLPPEARVGVLLRNRPGHVAAMLAVLASDRCLVSLNPI